MNAKYAWWHVVRSLRRRFVVASAEVNLVGEPLTSRLAGALEVLELTIATRFGR